MCLKHNCVLNKSYLSCSTDKLLRINKKNCSHLYGFSKSFGKQVVRDQGIMQACSSYISSDDDLGRTANQLYRKHVYLGGLGVDGHLLRS